MTDFLGKIGNLEFVTGAVAFNEAVKAYKEGRFGSGAARERMARRKKAAKARARKPAR